MTERFKIMKLFKKLIPLATIASTAVVAAPIVASCSSGTTKTWKYGDTFTPSIKEADLPTGSLTVAEAQTKYLEDAAKNKAILADDMMVILTATISSMLGSQVDSVSLTVSSVDKTNKTFSASCVVKVKIGDGTYSVDINCSKIPMLVKHNGTLFYVGVDASRVTETGWSVTVKAPKEITGGDAFNETYNSKTTGISEYAKEIAEGFPVPSYYLSKCTLKA